MAMVHKGWYAMNQNNQSMYISNKSVQLFGKDYYF